MVERNIDPSKLAAWSIDFIESSGQRGGEFTDMLRYYESLMMRGLLVPERAATEGQNGTKAEAESLAGIATSIAQDTLDQLIQQVNDQLTDRVLAANYGPQAVQTCYVKASPIIEEDKALIRQVAAALLTNPNLIDLVTEGADLDAIFKQAGIPMRETVENAQAKAGSAPNPATTAAYLKYADAQNRGTSQTG
jgi:hypothetical protein